MTVQELREKISQNSQAWHLTDDEEARKALHRENVGLYAQLDALTGSSSKFDNATGQWTSTLPGAGDYAAAPLPQPADRSAEIGQRERAATEKALAGIDRAYAKEVSALDAREAETGAGYQEARDRAAARNEVERHNLHEYAAGSGLNAGAVGQAALGQSVAAQAELGAIDRQERAAYDAIAAARAEMEADYAYAREEAQAEGDYALAKALADEAARYEAAQLERAKAQESAAQKVYESARKNRLQELSQQEKADELRRADIQEAYERARRAEQTAYDRQQDERAEAMKIAQSRAAFGDFQGYARLGYTQDQIDRMTLLWRFQKIMG